MADLSQRWVSGPIDEHMGHLLNYTEDKCEETSKEIIKFLDEEMEPWWQGLKGRPYPDPED